MVKKTGRPKGSSRVGYKFTDAQVQEARALMARGVTQAAVAKRLGMGRSTVLQIAKGRYGVDGTYAKTQDRQFIARRLKIKLSDLEPSPLTAHVERFLTSRRARGNEPTTVNWYEINLTVYLQWLIAHPELAWDQPETIDLYLWDQRASGLLKDSTLLVRYKSLCVWFAWLRRRRFVAEDPMELVDRPKVGKAAIEYMTLAEYQQLVGAITDLDWVDKRDRCLFYVLFWCGVRVAEACAMRVGDLDPARNRIKIQRGKGGDGRFVPCADDFFVMAEEYVSTRPQTDHDWLFLGSNARMPSRYAEKLPPSVRGKFTPSGASIVMKQRCKAAGLRHISPHKARHGIAMEMLNAGMDMSAVSKLLGHSAIATTAQFYARWLTGTHTQVYLGIRAQLLAMPEAASAKRLPPAIEPPPAPPAPAAVVQQAPPAIEKQPSPLIPSVSYLAYIAGRSPGHSA